MNRFTNLMMTLTVVGLGYSVGAVGQSVVSFAPKKQTDATSLTATQKKAADNQKSIEEAAKNFKSNLPLYSQSDRTVYGQFVVNKGTTPTTTQRIQPRKAANKAEASKWTYTGFNAAAGVAEDGTTATGGLVNYNLKPFECDTVSSDNGLSPYSYMAKGKLYSFLPNQDTSTGNFTTLTRTVYDANTLERLSQKTFTLDKNGKDRVPYLLSYDDQNDIVYAVSFNSNMPEGDTESYYLNVLDTATCQLKRIGYIGGYNDEAKNDFVPKAFTATGGILRFQVYTDSLYLYEINAQTLEKKKIGRMDIPTQYTYGLQPMIYDGNTGYLLVNHYDFNNGTQYYKVAPFLAYGAKDNVLKTELVEKTPTGFTFFYQRPESQTSYFKYHLADITDLKADAADGSNKVTVSFTVPNKDTEGNDITLPSYASKNFRCYVIVDNQYVTPADMPSSITYGSKVSFSLDLADGVHAITVQAYPLWNELEQARANTFVACGYDAPASVGSPTLAILGDVATISWKAPAEGRYADFGAKFDASDLTYKVVRNNDGKVIADGTANTTVQDNDLADEIQTYSYTIYAISHDNTGVGVKTNRVSAGKYSPLPYANDFSDKNCLDGFTVLNLDNNGSYRTWMWNNYYNNITSGGGSGDDWLITPSFKLDGNKLYEMSYKLSGSDYLRTTVGQGNTPEDQNNVLEDLQGYSTKVKDELHEVYFRPSESGTYNFGFYNYSIGGDAYWSIDDLSVKAVAPVTAPDKVRSLTFKADEKGALGGTLSFKLPATAINGNNLSSLAKVTVYDQDGKVVATESKVQPGGNTSIKVTAVHGWNTYKIIAANADGEGWPVSITKFVGADVPKAISNLKISWGEDRTVANLSWDAPTEGVNGGYVDPSTLNYKIYKYDANSSPSDVELGSSDNETSIEVTIKDAAEAQNQYVFSVTASNDQGMSDYARAGIVMGKPYDLPFEEAFTSKGVDHSPYIIYQGKNNQAWTIDGGYYNDKIQAVDNDGTDLVFVNHGSEDASSSFVSPIIDFTNAKKPVFSVWLHHSDAMPKEAYVTITATVDGSKDFIAASDSTSLTGNNGWTEHVFDLSKLVGKKAQLGLTAYVPDPSVRIFADKWNIHEATGNDLALASISQPYAPVVGDTADIAVTVSNNGAETANNYSVLFTVNGETIAEEEATEPLALGKAVTYHFTLPITAAQKELVYSAEVLYDGDTNADNNCSTEVELNPTQVNLPAPTDLALSGNDDLAWVAPEQTDGRKVTLGFEDQPAFKVDNIDNWTTYDGDGHLTLTFVQYYGNYWPYANQPFAWMTWSAKEAGCPTATAWTPYEGEKCLIHFGNYGADADGRTNTDPDDDWFISPEVKGGTELSFMTLSNEATSSIEVLTSNTDRDPASFTNKIETVGYETTGEWKEVKVTLPADAKYVAIHTIKDDFGIMIDNLSYTEAKAPVLLGYNVYNGLESTARVTENKAKATAGSGNYAVSAVYDLGESQLSNTVAVSTGIDDVNADAAQVTGGKGTITITGANGSNVVIYNAAGQRVAKSVSAATETVNVPAGVYIAKVGKKTYKVNVR